MTKTPDSTGQKRASGQAAHYRISVDGGFYSGASHFWQSGIGHSGGVCIIHSKRYAPLFSAKDIFRICRRLQRIGYPWDIEDSNQSNEVIKLKHYLSPDSAAPAVAGENKK